MQACKEIKEEARKRHWKREAGKKRILSNITNTTLKFRTQYLSLPLGQMWVYTCRNFWLYAESVWRGMYIIYLCGALMQKQRQGTKQIHHLWLQPYCCRWRALVPARNVIKQMISHQLALEIICKDIPYLSDAYASMWSKQEGWTIEQTHIC